MTKQKMTTRKEYDDELLKVFKVFYTEYLVDNKLRRYVIIGVRGAFRYNLNPI